MSPADIQHNDRSLAKCPVTGWPVINRPDWIYTQGDFTIRYEVLDGRIVHAIASGFLHADYVQPIFGLRRRVLAEAGLGEGFDGFIANFAAVSGSSYRARMKYIKLLKEQYQLTPFNIYITYGASRWLRTAVKISSLFTPFKVYVAADYEEAVTSAEGHASGTPPVAGSPGPEGDNSPAADREHFAEAYID